MNEIIVVNFGEVDSNFGYPYFEPETECLILILIHPKNWQERLLDIVNLSCH